MFRYESRAPDKSTTRFSKKCATSAAAEAKSTHSSFSSSVFSVWLSIVSVTRVAITATLPRSPTGRISYRTRALFADVAFSCETSPKKATAPSVVVSARGFESRAKRSARPETVAPLSLAAAVTSGCARKLAKSASVKTISASPRDGRLSLMRRSATSAPGSSTASPTLMRSERHVRSLRERQFVPVMSTRETVPASSVPALASTATSTDPHSTR
mmetsp:Transcript_7890/g.33586  ORF Transcript_7890/g.33586 Transcript_7890/m.33586 type:complete len:215 (-) Transcript_7890:208-852(-)